MSLFMELNDEGRAIVMVTHNPQLALCAKEIVELTDGRVVSRSVVQDRVLPVIRPVEETAQEAGAYTEAREPVLQGDAQTW
jgi:ABC-type lipoprotein export system ATPase subunit